MKYDAQMPRVLNHHFREIEVRIVSESAWHQSSSVVEIVKQQARMQEELKQIHKLEEAKTPIS